MATQLTIELFVPGVGSQVVRYDLDAPVMKAVQADEPLAKISVGEPGGAGFQIVITKGLTLGLTPAGQAEVKSKAAITEKVVSPVAESEVEKKYKVEGDCVYKKNADGSLGERLKCYEGENAHEQAEAYARALYSNVPDAKKSAPPLDLTVVKPLTPVKGKPLADAVEVVLKAISPQLLNQMDKGRRIATLSRLRTVIDQVEDQPRRKNFQARLAALEGGAPLGPDGSQALEREGGFVVKMVQGQLRWFGRPSLNIEDRVRETVSKAALEGVVEHEKARGHFPRLEFFHTDIPIGYTDDYRVVDGILVATGGFNDDRLSQTVAKFYLAHPESTDGSGWAMSWRFFGTPNADGVYERGKIRRIREFSVLPTSQAALPLTHFDLKEVA